MSGSSRIPSDDAGRVGSHSNISGHLPPLPHGLLRAPPHPGGGWKESVCNLGKGTQPTCTIEPSGLWLSYSLCQELPAPCGKLILIPQNPIPSTSSLETFSSHQKPFSGSSSRIQGNLRPPPTLTFPVFEQQFPNFATGSRVHSSCRLIQDNDLGATHKGNGH